MATTNKWIQLCKRIISGKPHDVSDPGVFHRLSLIAFFAWIGLGSDALSSSAYGPAEAFAAIGHHPYLAVFVALASAVTIFVISGSYAQIIEQFPSGGGGYLVATKLLSPFWGMISGSALIIDYILTITISVASGADALFSFLPIGYHPFKFWFAVLGIILLIWLNIRGAKESVIPLVPIFIIFLVSHAFAIGYSIVVHWSNLHGFVGRTSADFHQATASFGLWGTVLILLRSYVMGAGTYTGIEAVSNGLPILKEPRVRTAKRVMLYMAISLSVVVFGLMIAYLLFGVTHTEGKTMNAVLFENMSAGWGHWGSLFVFVTLVSEAALLLVAAQTGFLDGPRVIANMAIDRWLPTRFAMLNNRLVTQNGVVIMGIAAIAMLFLTQGSVQYLIVLYSINVFITFTLSQMGMVRHWIHERRLLSLTWWTKFAINTVGFLITVGILCAVFFIKFEEGGWITVVITLSLAAIAYMIKRHYYQTAQIIRKLQKQIHLPGYSESELMSIPLVPGTVSPTKKTAVLLVSGFDAVGIHGIQSISNLFGDTYEQVVFIQIGVVDAGSFKDNDTLIAMRQRIETNLKKYIHYVNDHGLIGAGYYALGIDIVDEIMKLMPTIRHTFPKSVFFAGLVVFKEESFINRLLHNHTVFEIQKELCIENIPFVALPLKV
ncbi:APC family permease [bacterium]|nr:APC family permease [bacterium]